MKKMILIAALTLVLTAAAGYFFSEKTKNLLIT